LRRTVGIIPFLERPDLNVRSLASLRRNNIDMTIMIDNGSQELPTKLWMESESGRDIIFLDGTGMNIHEMWNLGIKKAASLYDEPVNLFILNNDVVLGDSCIRELSYVSRKYGTTLVSPNYDGRLGGGFFPTQKLCHARYDGTGGIAGFAMFLDSNFAYEITFENDYENTPTKTLLETRRTTRFKYLFPEELNWWYGDDDLMMSIRLDGGLTGICLDAKAEHIGGGGQTGKWTSPKYTKQLFEDQAWFIRKWTRP